MENWKPIPGYENSYEVSDHGNVRSLWREVKYGRHGQTIYKGRELKQTRTKNGYLSVKLSTHDGPKTAYVHHLVLRAFVGERPFTIERSEIRHLDGHKRNNRLSNLCYGTAKENAEDRKRHRGAE
jgi:hypothetical protein